MSFLRSSRMNVAERLRRLDTNVEVLITLRRFLAEDFEGGVVEGGALPGQVGERLDSLDADGRIGVVLESVDQCLVSVGIARGARRQVLTCVHGLDAIDLML